MWVGKFDENREHSRRFSLFLGIENRETVLRRQKNTILSDGCPFNPFSPDAVSSHFSFDAVVKIMEAEKTPFRRASHEVDLRKVYQG